MQTLKGVICLDNFETVWDADTLRVEALLAKFTSLPNLTVMITSRGSNRPLQTTWTKPLLAPIGPLSEEAALQIWD